jgi:hypothetical protein
MSRHGYSDDGCDDLDSLLANGRWQAQVNSAMRGKRGQALLRDLIAALDEMSEKRLVRGVLEREGSVCALGAVCKRRGVPMPEIDGGDASPEEWSGELGAALDVAHQLAAHVMWVNDEMGRYHETPEERWQTVRGWAGRELERIEREATKKAQRLLDKKEADGG